MRKGIVVGKGVLFEGIELSKKKQEKYEEIDRNYGAEFDKRYQARMEKYREAMKKLRDVVIY